MLYRRNFNLLTKLIKYKEKKIRVITSIIHDLLLIEHY